MLGRQGGGEGLSCSQLPISKAGTPGEAPAHRHNNAGLGLSGATGWCRGGEKWKEGGLVS